MGDLVYHGDPDFLDNLLMGLADRQDRIPEDLDAIWQARVELTAFGEWNAGVEPQRVRQVRRRVVLDLANYIDEVLHGFSACRLARASNLQLRSCRYHCDEIRVLRSLSFLWFM